jgi:hypothetical protein
MYSTADRWTDYDQDYNGINASSNYLDHQQINAITNLSSVTTHESGTLLSLDSDNNTGPDYK